MVVGHLPLSASATSATDAVTIGESITQKQRTDISISQFGLICPTGWLAQPFGA
jgi:hypothetical protein